MSHISGRLRGVVVRVAFAVAMLAALAVVLPAAASAAQRGTVTLYGYGGVPEQVYTTENTYLLYTALGSAG